MATDKHTQCVVCSAPIRRRSGPQKTCSNACSLEWRDATQRARRLEKRTHNAQVGRAWRARNADRVKANKRAWQARNAERRKVQMREWRAHNKDRRRQYARWWDANNADKRKASYERHKERALASARRWKRENAEYYREYYLNAYARNPDKPRAASRAWRQSHREQVIAQKSLRRARKMGAASGDRRAFLAFVKRARKIASAPCYWCGKRTRPSSRHLDHIIPLAKGGPDAAGNLCIACPTCNARKGAKLPEDFAGQSEMRFT